MKKSALCFLAALTTGAGIAAAQVTVTVGPNQFSLPSGWQSVGVPGVPYAMVMYTDTSNGGGMAIMMDFPDTSAAHADSMAQMYASILSGNGGFTAVSDSNYTGGAGRVSLVNFMVVDTANQPPDTSYGRFYFAYNGSSGVFVEVIPQDSASADPIYRDITTLLKTWATTSIRGRTSLRGPGFEVKGLYDILGRSFPSDPRLRKLRSGSGSLIFIRP